MTGPLSNPPLVSAVITTFNYGRYVVDAVSSVLAQTYPHLEVIVVDDGSTDDTVRRLEPFRDRIRYIYQPNEGVSAARNRGIALARGSYIGLLDADDQWHPRKTEIQVRLLTGVPPVAVVGSDVCTDLAAGWRSLPQSWPPPGSPVSAEQLVIRSRFAPSTALIRKDCLLAVGGFRHNISGAEDRDLLIRLAASYPTVCLDWPLAYYRNHGSNLSTGAARMETVDHRMIASVFADLPALQGRPALRRKADSYAACMAGFLYTASNDQPRALSRILKSLALWPLSYEPGTPRSTLFRLKMATVIVLRMLRLKPPHSARQSYSNDTPAAPHQAEAA